MERGINDQLKQTFEQKESFIFQKIRLSSNKRNFWHRVSLLYKRIGSQVNISGASVQKELSDFHWNYFRSLNLIGQKNFEAFSDIFVIFRHICHVSV